MLGFLLLAICLAVSGLAAALGVPLFYGWVAPNRLYGFRTPQTLKDPAAWYPANRVCGYWLIVTGILTAGVAAGQYAAGVEAPYALFFTLVALLTGVIVMAVQSDSASRLRAVPKTQTQFRLLSLFILTTITAIGCAIVRLPVHWAFRAGLLSAYLVCVVGLLIRDKNRNAPSAS